MHTRPGQTRGHRHVQVSGRGDYGRIVTAGQRLIQVVVDSFHAVLRRDLLGQGAVDLADRRLHAAGRQEAAQMALADRTDADDEDVLHVRR